MRTEFKEYNNNSNGDCVIYRDIILKNGKFYVLNNDNRLKNNIYLSRGFYHKIKLNDGFSHIWEPKYKNIENIDIDIIEEVTTFFCEEEVPGHIGHTLFDSIAAQFASLKICNIELNNKTKIKTLQKLYRYEKKMDNLDKYEKKQKAIPHARTSESFMEKTDIKGSYDLLFGEKKTYLHHYLKENMDKTILFKCLVVGSSHKGVGSFNYEFKSLNGYNGAWRDFRDYCYLRCGCVGNVPSYILLNKPTISERTDRQIVNVDNIINVLKNKKDSKIISWSKLDSLKEQIILLSQTLIYISTDGSASLNSIFLSNNSILINLGLVKNNIVYYRSDYVFTACSYIKVIYLNDFLQNKYKINSNILLDNMINDPKKYYSKDNYSNLALTLKNNISNYNIIHQKLFIFNMLLLGKNDFSSSSINQNDFNKLIYTRFIKDFKNWEKQ